MKIIDMDRKGNVVRFYLGEKTKSWGWTDPNYKVDGKTPDWLRPSDTYYGDDWDDAPYEHNAGSVYDQFVKGTRDVAFPFDWVLVEPRDTWSYNSPFCKDDMVARKCPCLIAIPDSYLKKNDLYDWQVDSYEKAAGISEAIKVYYGDDASILDSILEPKAKREGAPKARNQKKGETAK